jgi:hypothetical protein
MYRHVSCDIGLHHVSNSEWFIIDMIDIDIDINDLSFKIFRSEIITCKQVLVTVILVFDVNVNICLDLKLIE